jgi:hypothetical protein
MVKFLFFSLFLDKRFNIFIKKNNDDLLKINESIPFDTHVPFDNHVDFSDEFTYKMNTTYYKYDVYKYLLDPSNNLNIKLEKAKEYQSLFLENSLKKQLEALYTDFKKVSFI